MMTSFVPDLTVLVQFTLAAIVLTVTPGPDMVLFLSRGINHGRAAGLACMFGASTGVLVHTTFAAVGLSALLAASATAFTIVKLVGAAYLIWLAWQSIRGGPTLKVERRAAVKSISLTQHYMTGIGINLLNPKIILFFVSFLPQFIDANDPAATGKLVFLGVFFLAIAIPIVTPMILAADRFSKFLLNSPRISRGLDWVLAGVFGAFALKILTTQARS